MCTPLFDLKESIDVVMEELSPILIERFWSIFTPELDDIILSSIINGKTTFSPHTAEQLRYNMKALFSFIKPYYSPKETLFPKYVY